MRSLIAKYKISDICVFGTENAVCRPRAHRAAEVIELPIGWPDDVSGDHAKVAEERVVTVDDVRENLLKPVLHLFAEICAQHAQQRGQNLLDSHLKIYNVCDFRRPQLIQVRYAHVLRGFLC